MTDSSFATEKRNPITLKNMSAIRFTLEEVLTATGGKLLTGQVNLKGPHSKGNKLPGPSPLDSPLKNKFLPDDQPLTGFTGISTDSRTIAPGELFFALPGSRFDGHHYLNQVGDRGGAGAVIEEGKLPSNRYPERQALPIIAVEDTLTALGDLARWHRLKLSPAVVAITGTNGKTTTKELAASILSLAFPVLKSPLSYNNLVGLPLTLLSLRGGERIVVLEMGMNRSGEIRRLAQIARPDIGLVTNISPAHLEELKTLPAVAQAKGELWSQMEKWNQAIINIDDPLVVDIAREIPCQKLTYGIKSPAHLQAIDIEPENGKSISFKIRKDMEEMAVHLKLPGLPNIYNALAAGAIGAAFALPLSTIKEGLERVEPLWGRLQSLPLAHNLLLINDCYNANPQSMKLALEHLSRIKNRGRAIACLGDMLELGPLSESAHQELGKVAARLDIDYLLLRGPHAEFIAAGAQMDGFPPGQILIEEGEGGITSLLEGIIKPGDRVLVKGSRRMGMEDVVDWLKEKYQK